MKSLNSIIRTLSITSFVVLLASRSDPDEEVMESMDIKASSPADESAEINKVQTKLYSVDFTALNGSGVSASGELTLVGDQLIVKIHATGLEPNEPHPQHIHGFMENKANSTCPASATDTNDDGLLILSEDLLSMDRFFFRFIYLLMNSPWLMQVVHLPTNVPSL